MSSLVTHQLRLSRDLYHSRFITLDIIHICSHDLLFYTNLSNERLLFLARVNSSEWFIFSLLTIFPEWESVWFTFYVSSLSFRFEVLHPGAIHVLGSVSTGAYSLLISTCYVSTWNPYVLWRVRLGIRRWKLKKKNSPFNPFNVFA